MITAEIITIGDEILIGQIVDTNSIWIAEQLNLIGIKVFQITSISDNSQHIENALKEASSRVDVVLITGGLGPTKDDITKYTLAKYFKSNKMLLHEPSLEKIKSIFVKRDISLTELNVKQAEVPDNCTVVVNNCGTAPGMWFERDGKIFMSMPGVPYEMRAMMKDVLCLLSNKFETSGISHKSLMTFGIPESLLSDMIETWELALPTNLKLAYLPNLATGVKLRLSAFGENRVELEQQIKDEFTKLIPILGSSFYGYEPDNLESTIGRYLAEKGLTLATAESCTGGNIAHKITSIAGSSAYFKGSMVAYSNQVKINVLGVNSDTLNKYGAVSNETVEQMAIGVRGLLQADYSIATSGIAGPTGGTTDKPVGLCHFAISGPKGTKTYSQVFPSDRSGNILRATAAALNYFRLFLLDEQ